MKAFITKYALTQGIYEVEAKDVGKGMIEVSGVSMFPDYYSGDDWHDTLEKAIRRANKMRSKKIDDLEKQIEKLRNMNFREARR